MFANTYFNVLKKKEELEKEAAKNGYNLTNIILANNLRTTSTYKECMRLYKEYIYRAADFISTTYPCIASLETTILVDYLLWSGFFSYNGEHKYYDYPYEEELLCEMIGIKTLTGACVCRHMSSFVAAILNLEYSASFVAVKIIRRDSLTQVFQDRLNPKYKHAVVGVGYKGEKFLYDPTHRTLAHKMVKEDTSIEGNRIASIFGEIPFPFHIENEEVLYLQAEENFPIYKALPEEFYSEEIVKAPLVYFENEKLLPLVREIQKMYIQSRKKREAFQEENADLTRRIVKDAESLMPKSDEPLKKWLVRR